MFKCLNNLFTHSFKVVIRIMYARLFQNNRNWGLRTSKNFASNEGDNLDKSLRELKSLGKFKKAIHNVTF